MGTHVWERYATSIYPNNSENTFLQNTGIKSMKMNDITTQKSAILKLVITANISIYSKPWFIMSKCILISMNAPFLSFTYAICSHVCMCLCVLHAWEHAYYYMLWDFHPQNINSMACI
jgi:hypothetical protein